MTSEWDGTPWAGSLIKAETGPFVANVQYGTYLSGLSRSPQKRMREAQTLYHTNPWIRTAEAAVTRKVVGLGWHLEDQADEEIPDNAAGVPGEVLRLLERPQADLEGIGHKMTRRELWAITSRHIGLCGMAYWYLDSLTRPAGIPLGIIYVNPARVWCATDANGNLTGWVVDAKDDHGHGGTPYELDELLPFYLDPPDWGHYGSGLVEAFWQKAQLTSLADRHAAYILGTGGRIPGLVAPKEGTIGDEQYKTLVAEFRNVNEAPDAAKRTTILRGPVDFTPTASDPKNLELSDLSKTNRDDILAGWGVPPSQAAIPGAAGLNSGETKGYDEAILMQGSVHDRVVSIRETIQYGLLDRWQKIGWTFDLEIEEPEFDDEAPMYENAVRAINIPMKNFERRAIIGLEPFGDPVLDDAILLPLTLTEFTGEPEPVAPPPTIDPTMKPMPTPGMEPDMMGKAANSKFLGLRSKMEARFVPSLRKSMTGLLAEQRLTVAARIRERGDKLSRKRNDATIWWDTRAEDERLAKVLRSGELAIAQTVARQIDSLLKTPGKAVAYEDQVLTYVAKRTGERIGDINRTTRDAIQAAIIQGFEDGLSPSQIGDLIETLPAFDEARAELVARTETMLAYNDAALTSYAEFGVTEVLAYDGDQDEECAARDGQTFSLEESYDITDHPNGTLDWAPVVGRAYLDQSPMADALTAAMRSMSQPPVVNLPAPVVNIEPTPAPIVHIPRVDPPIVNVEPPIVNVAPPTVNVPAPIVNVDMTPVANMIGELRDLMRRPTVKDVLRDKDGRILRVTET